MTKTTGTKRINTGRYLTVDGFQVVKVVDWDMLMTGEGWHLIAPDGEWCNTFATKRDAVEAAAEIAAEEAGK